MAMNLSFPSQNEPPPDITYVALAATLLPPDLQAQASAAGLCHVQVTGYTVANQHCIQVAALPHRFEEATSSRRVFTLWVDAEQLSHALPWDRSLQGLPTCDVREHLLAQAVALKDAPSHSIATQMPEHRSVDGPELQEPLAPQQDETTVLLPLPELFVSCETVHEAVAEAAEPLLPRSSGRRTSWTRLAWLHAALAMVRRQMSHACQAFMKLDILLEKVIATQRRFHQSLVSASAVYVGERLVGWRLQIAYPMREVLA